MLGTKIKELRKQKGYSQADLGDLIGITNKAISKWEAGNNEPDLAMLFKMAQIFGVTTDELLDNSKKINNQQGKISNINNGELLVFNSIKDGSEYEIARLTKKTIIRPDNIVSSHMECISGASVKGIINIPAVYDGKSVTKIAQKAFYMCPNLEGIVIPIGIEVIGNSAFSGCKSITEIIIPDGVTTIGNFAFMNCSKLRTVKLPESIKIIGDNAFSNCPELTEINIPADTSFCRAVFSRCEKLKELKLVNIYGEL